MTNLGLYNNKIGDVGASALGEALKVNAVLNKLLLTDNSIGPAGATALADALKVNAVMTNLIIGQNKIGDVGATALGDALKVNAVLTELYNQMGKTLLPAVQVRNTIRNIVKSGAMSDEKAGPLKQIVADEEEVAKLRREADAGEAKAMVILGLSYRDRLRASSC